jgi:hypothetical protein
MSYVAWEYRAESSESTRFLGQPDEIKPTVGGVGGEFLITYPLCRGLTFLRRSPVQSI